MKSEAEFQTAFGRFIVSEKAEGIVSGGAAFELKAVERGKGLPFSAVKDHQRESLLRARGASCEGCETEKFERTERARGLYHKISDFGPGFKPLDCVVIRNGGAWVVVMYYAPAVKHFYVIDVLDFLDEEREAGENGGRGRKSLKEERAAEIGAKYEL